MQGRMSSRKSGQGDCDSTMLPIAHVRPTGVQPQSGPRQRWPRSISDRGAQAEDGGVLDGGSVRIAWVRDVAAWAEDVLKVRLNRPTRHDLGLIRDLNQGLAGPKWQSTSGVVVLAHFGVDCACGGKEAGVAVAFACPLRDLGMAETDAKGVVRASGDEAFERHASIGLEADEVAVRGIARHAREHADALVS